MDYTKINDYEVLYLVKENDEVATELLYKKYQPLIDKKAYYYYRLYQSRGIDLDELKQEGYVGLQKALSQFDEHYDNLFYTFALLCIDRQMRTCVKRAKSAKEAFYYQSLSLENDVEASGTMESLITNPFGENPKESIEITFLYQCLTEFKHTLPYTESCVFELRTNGFKYKEIARLLNLSSRLVENYLYKSRKLLRKYLDKKLNSIV